MSPRIFESVNVDRKGNPHEIKAMQFNDTPECRRAIKEWSRPVGQIIKGDLHINGSIVHQAEWVVRFNSGWFDVMTPSYFNLSYKEKVCAT